MGETLREPQQACCSSVTIHSSICPLDIYFLLCTVPSGQASSGSLVSSVPPLHYGTSSFRSTLAYPSREKLSLEFES